MLYKGIMSNSEFKNGSWCTIFYIHDDPIKTVEWKTSFNEDDIKKIIDNEILPFI